MLFDTRRTSMYIDNFYRTSSAEFFIKQDWRILNNC